MLFDTHCHLNFARFKNSLPDVIQRAKDVGVTHILIPATDIPTAIKAIEIAEKEDQYFVAIGIHPHHIYEGLKTNDEIQTMRKLIVHPKVVAVGEVGMDKHEYRVTKYQTYIIDENFLLMQRALLTAQIELAKEYNKSLILHNREAMDDLIEVLKSHWDTILEHQTVLHCCEPDTRMLELAKKYHMFIGVDGDITYSEEKQQFIKEVPLEMLVLETDAPFLLPEPLRTEKKYPNEPAHLTLIAHEVARIKGISYEEVASKTFENAQILFGL
ncbi:MAG: TatD family hydrolase [Candidatus Roizmanbacteria bacterium]